MKPITVLIVDDCVVVRRLLTEILSAEEGIEVVGATSSKAGALAKIEQTRPDVVTLDVEMPGTSGLELLEKIREHYPRLPVLMFSSLTVPAGAATLDAMARGSGEYLSTPTLSDRVEATVQVRSELVRRLRGMRRRPSSTSVSAVLPRATRPHRTELHQAEVLAIGASTGGPNALAALVSSLMPTISVPIVIVQHMPPLFTKILADRLASLGRVPVREAVDGDELEPGKALIAPGGYHMRVVRKGGRQHVALDQGPPVNSCRPAVDNLFESASEVYGPGVLAVVLTGMGQDGFRGCEKVRASGGQVVVQDEATSVVWGMPGFVARANLAHAVLPLDAIATEILVRVSSGRTSQVLKAIGGSRV